MTIMKILCADAIASDLFEPLRDQGHDVVIEPDLAADTIPSRLTELGANVLVVRSTKVTDAAITATPQLGLVVRAGAGTDNVDKVCLLYTSPSPRDRTRSRMPSSA